MTDTETQHRTSAQSNAARLRELNATTRFTMWSVFRVDAPVEPSPSGPSGPSGPSEREASVAELHDLFDELGERDVLVRGTYDVSGTRADADLLLWTHAPDAAALQDAYRAFRRTRFGRRLAPVWSQLALHRPAEFNQSHVPAFLAEEVAREWVSVYPFVRSYEWYLLPDDERRALLAEHGRMGRGYPDVRANTVPSFALGDYEWILAFESDDLRRIVDLMRDLRASGARRHVRVETPFYTGRRRPIAELVE